MIERTALAVSVAAAMAAAAALAVFSLGFAVYALASPFWGAAGAAALVALIAAAGCAIAGGYAATRARKVRKEQEIALAQAEAQAAMAPPVGPDPMAMISDIVRDRPMLALGVGLAAAVFAARRPDVVRQIARFVGQAR